MKSFNYIYFFVALPLFGMEMGEQPFRCKISEPRQTQPMTLSAAVTASNMGMPLPDGHGVRSDLEQKEREHKKQSCEQSALDEMPPLDQDSLDLALYDGVRTKNLTLVKQALDNGANPNRYISFGNDSNSKHSMLGAALKLSNIEIVETLLARGANPWMFSMFHKQTKCAFAPIAQSVVDPTIKPEFVKLLLRFGAKVHDATYAVLNDSAHAWNPTGQTALHLLCARGPGDDVSEKLGILAAHGADFNLKDASGKKAFIDLMKTSFTLKDGTFTMHGADPQVIKKAMGYGARIFAEDTALMEAALRHACGMVDPEDPEMIQLKREHEERDGVEEYSMDSFIVAVKNQAIEPWVADNRSKVLDALREGPSYHDKEYARQDRLYASPLNLDKTGNVFAQLRAREAGVSSRVRTKQLPTKKQPEQAQRRNSF